MSGQVIGISTAIVAEGRGIGFAIPINMAKELLPQLKKGKIVRGWLGVVIQNMTPDMAQYFGMEEAKGVVVAQVIKGGPADAAGMRQGDIILTLNAQEVETSAAFSRSVAELRPGEEIKLGIIREGKERTLPVTIGKMPEEQAKEEPEAAPTEHGEGRLGFTVQNLTPQIARAIGLSPNETAVVVSEVVPGSPADDAGLEAGDVIREVNRQPVSSLEQFRNAVQKRKGQGMLFLVQRKDVSFYATLVPDQQSGGQQ
jgi:serine protease Do